MFRYFFDDIDIFILYIQARNPITIYLCIQKPQLLYLRTTCNLDLTSISNL